MDPQTPDIYFTSAQIKISGFDVLIQLKKSDADDPNGTTVGCIRTSLAHAKVLAILLTKNIHEMERILEADLPIPPDMLATLKINLKEDW